MKLSNYIKAGLTFGVVSLFAVGCSTGEPTKDTYLDAADTIQEAETMELSYSMSVDYGDKAGMLAPDKLEVSLPMKADLEHDLYEFTIETDDDNPLFAGIEDTAMLMDLEKDMMYASAKEMYDTQAGLLGGGDEGLPEEYENSLVEMDISGDDELDELATDGFQTQETIVEDLDDDRFEADEDTLTFNISGEEMNEYMKDQNLPYTLDDADFNDDTEFHITATFDGKDLASEKVTTETDNGEDPELDVTIEYQSINEDIDFSIDKDSDDVIDENEWAEIMTGGGDGPLGGDEDDNNGENPFE